MKYEMTRPCDDCPFLKRGGVRVYPNRTLGIALAVLRGDDFSCHKTIEYDDEGHAPIPRGDNEQMCAGAMIFSEKNGFKMFRGGLKPLDKKAFRQVFSNVGTMLRAALPFVR